MWARLDDRVAFHPKVMAAGNAAAGAWFRMIAYCSAHLSDGFVADKVARSIASQTELKKLLNEGLVDAAPGGFLVHDYLDWNPSAAAVKSEREKEAKRKADARNRADVRPDVPPDRKSDNRPDGDRTTGGQNSPSRARVPVPSGSRPEETNSLSRDGSTGTTTPAPLAAHVEAVYQEITKRPSHPQAAGPIGRAVEAEANLGKLDGRALLRRVIEAFPAYREWVKQPGIEWNVRNDMLGLEAHIGRLLSWVVRGEKPVAQAPRKPPERTVSEPNAGERRETVVPEVQAVYDRIEREKREEAAKHEQGGAQIVDVGAAIARLAESKALKT